MYVKGKRGIRVPIILTPDVISAMDMLIKTRSSVGVSSNNRYVFAAPTRNSSNHLRGNDCLTTVVKKVEEVAGLKCPKAIQSIKLRKYCATVSQILNLEDNELDWLARLVAWDIYFVSPPPPPLNTGLRLLKDIKF